MDFLDVKEVGELLRISRASVYRLLSRRLIPFYRLSRGIRIKREDVFSFLEKSRVETVA